MSDYPHVYITTSFGTKESHLELTSDKLPSLEVTPPPQFGGPEGFWNPEVLFCASISSCFILTFRAVARGMKLDWSNLKVEVKAYLDREDGALRFTKVEIFAFLEICCENNIDPFLKALKKAEESCLITKSINAEKVLYPKIKIVSGKKPST